MKTNDVNEDYPQQFDKEDQDSSYPANNNSQYKLDTILSTVNFANNIVDKFSDTRVSIADIDKDIHNMDLQFNSYIANLDFQLNKYHTSAPIVREQLNNLDKMMDRILDKVLDIDTDDEQKLNFKIRLLESLDNYSDKLSSMMAKLL